jgi:hypothetical protein
LKHFTSPDFWALLAESFGAGSVRTPNTPKFFRRSRRPTRRCTRRAAVRWLGTEVAYVSPSSSASRQLHFAPSELYRRSRQLPCRSGAGAFGRRAGERPIRWADAGKFASLHGYSDNRLMTTAGKHIVKDFETLPDAEKREVLVRLLTISNNIEYPEIADDELLGAADQLFLEYERRETGK